MQRSRRSAGPTSCLGVEARQRLLRFVLEQLTSGSNSRAAGTPRLRDLPARQPHPPTHPPPQQAPRARARPPPRSSPSRGGPGPASLLPQALYCCRCRWQDERAWARPCWAPRWWRRRKAPQPGALPAAAGRRRPLAQVRAPAPVRRPRRRRRARRRRRRGRAAARAGRQCSRLGSARRGKGPVWGQAAGARHWGDGAPGSVLCAQSHSEPRPSSMPKPARPTCAPAVRLSSVSSASAPPSPCRLAAAAEAASGGGRAACAAAAADGRPEMSWRRGRG